MNSTLSFYIEKGISLKRNQKTSLSSIGGMEDIIITSIPIKCLV